MFGIYAPRCNFIKINKENLIYVEDILYQNKYSNNPVTRHLENLFSTMKESSFENFHIEFQICYRLHCGGLIQCVLVPHKFHK